MLHFLHLGLETAQFLYASSQSLDLLLSSSGVPKID